MEKIFELAQRASQLRKEKDPTFSGTGELNNYTHFTFKDFTVMNVADEVISFMERLKAEYQMALD
jgi:hypothetical protein